MAVSNSWRDIAACKNADIEVFFNGAPSAIVTALKVCHGCPVMLECRDAGDIEEKHVQWAHGIRGGETAEKRMARRNRAMLVWATR